MAKNAEKRMVECEKCNAKYTFTVPQKTGFFRLKCPRCGKEIIFKTK